jgi:hypothetical protein
VLLQFLQHGRDQGATGPATPMRRSNGNVIDVTDMSRLSVEGTGGRTFLAPDISHHFGIRFGDENDIVITCQDLLEKLCC